MSITETGPRSVAKVCPYSVDYVVGRGRDRHAVQRSDHFGARNAKSLHVAGASTRLQASERQARVAQGGGEERVVGFQFDDRDEVRIDCPLHCRFEDYLYLNDAWKEYYHESMKERGE